MKVRQELSITDEYALLLECAGTSAPITGIRKNIFSPIAMLLALGLVKGGGVGIGDFG